MDDPRDTDRIPEHMMESIKGYTEHHTPVGDFLSGVICNDLIRACRTADSTSIQIIPAYVRWFYNNAPSACWGSKEKVNNWLDQGEMNELNRSEGHQ